MVLWEKATTVTYESTQGNQKPGTLDIKRGDYSKYRQSTHKHVHRQKHKHTHKHTHSCLVLVLSQACTADLQYTSEADITHISSQVHLCSHLYHITASHSL